MELVEWINIRGPIGPARQDHYFTTLMLMMARTSGNEKSTWGDLLPPWLRPDEASGVDFVTPWVSYDE